MAVHRPGKRCGTVFMASIVHSCIAQDQCSEVVAVRLRLCAASQALAFNDERDL